MTRNQREAIQDTVAMYGCFVLAMVITSKVWSVVWGVLGLIHAISMVFSNKASREEEGEE